MGSAVTDESGSFQIAFDESYFQELFHDRRPDLFFRVFRGEELIKSTEDAVLWNISAENLQVVIDIEVTDMTSDRIEFTVNVNFQEVTSEQQPPPTSVYGFDAKGQFLASASVENNQAILSLPANTTGQVVRFMVGPEEKKLGTDIEDRPPKMAQLKRLKAYEKRLRVNPALPRLEVSILQPIWVCWHLCLCIVRGRLVKRIPFPDGTVREFPVCNARVTICEVDPIYIILQRLPDHLILRLRDELLHPIPIPIPVPPWQATELELEPFSPQLQPFSEVQTLSTRADLIGEESPAVRGEQIADAARQSRVQALTGMTSLPRLRQELVNLSDLIRPYICVLPWLRPFWYRVDCLRTVNVDENGEFGTFIAYYCHGDKPDLYFKAEQLQGGIWQTIYKPPIPCHVYWNYACGSEVVLNVTDPSAMVCVPEEPVDPPTGVTAWILPFAVGGTKILGTPSTSPPSGLMGWVLPDGKTNYKDAIRPNWTFLDAPFGGSLGFRQNYSNNINGDDAGPAKSKDAIQYYRWCYRQVGASEWKQMDVPVFRHYVKQRTGELPSFPVYKLGPHTVGSQSNLFQFRPSKPPIAPGYQTSWPVDNGFGDIYSGFLNTLALSPDVKGAAGQYQIKLEVFDTEGKQVKPGSGFQFVVSQPHTIDARETQIGEVDATGGFIFNLHIDNNPCTATIDKPAIGTTTITDDCGFLRYPITPTPVTIAFHARHNNGFAKFLFRIIRGKDDVIAARSEVLYPFSGQEVTLTSPVVPLGCPYTGDGSGNFTKDFPRETLLCKAANNCCVNAAFAESLNVYAKATTGWGRRITAYDASDLRAFALAPQEVLIPVPSTKVLGLGQD